MHNVTFGYKCLVHFSIWTKCVSDGCRDANTRTAHNFLKNFSKIRTWASKKIFHNSLFRMKRECTTSSLSQNNKAYNGTNESVKIVVSLHCVTPLFSTSTADNRRPLKCTKYLYPKSHIVHVVFLALLLQEANNILILFWT